MPSSHELVRSEKTSRSAKASKKPSKSTRSGKTGASQRSEKSQKSAKSSRSEKSGKSRRSQKSCRSEKSSRKSKKQPPVDGIRLLHPSGEVIVKEEDLVAVSVLMMTRQAQKKLGKAIDLRLFSQDCVVLIAEYVQKRTIKAQVSFFTVAEVLKLTKAFIMEELHRRMEEVLVDAALQSAPNLIQALLVNDVAPVSRETEVQLHYLGAWTFLELVRLPDFHKMPPNQFMQIFGSCELNVPHELVAVDAALYWLAGQPNIDVLAPAVFALVRAAYLGPTERGMIVERTAVLNFPEPMVRMVKALLDSRHNGRICIHHEHISRHIPRCGVADLSQRPTEITLPLSRPRDGLIRRPEPKKENSKTERSVAEQSRKNSRKSTKGSKKISQKKSGKSGKSQKRRVQQKSTAVTV